MATATNIDLSGVDFSEIFSSDTSNTTYTSKYPSLGNLAINPTDVLRGTNSVGFQISGQDAVAVFSPIFKDVTTNGSRVIDIPIWASKVGFVVQAAGGAGGVAFTNYWRHIAIPAYYQRATTFSNRNTSAQQSSRNYTQNSARQTDFYQTNRPFGGWHRNYFRNYGSTYGRTYFRTYGRTYAVNYTTNYSRNTVSQLSYYSSSGGGGSCCAGVYNIQIGDKATKMTISCNINGNSAIQFNDSKQTNSVANNGGDVVLNSSSGTSGTPIEYTIRPSPINPGGTTLTTSTTNSSTDTRGIAGTAVHNDPGSYITHKYTSSGSDGATTTGQTTIIGGNGGIDTGTTGDSIRANFAPVIPSSNRGNGGNGSNSNVKVSGTSGMIRYWFIR
jgi:hypothetical protein